MLLLGPPIAFGWMDNWCHPMMRMTATEGEQLSDAAWLNQLVQHFGGVAVGSHGAPRRCPAPFGSPEFSALSSHSWGSQGAGQDEPRPCLGAAKPYSTGGRAEGEVGCLWWSLWL